mmetsp:Transcript_47413/g.148346  ORF Transcript_47413/g.148346 Transcript_47413/m.148346 type:complete len:101 (+) Transcript_47413:2-304(+)
MITMLLGRLARQSSSSPDVCLSSSFDGFYTCWSREFVGPGLKLSSNLLRAAFENKVSQGKSMSVRSEAEIPLDIGEHFFELSISIPGQHKGACLQVMSDE